MVVEETRATLSLAQWKMKTVLTLMALEQQKRQLPRSRQIQEAATFDSKSRLTSSHQ
jgi:hypothetical protein